MNKKIFGGFLCVLFVLMCSSAFAAGNFYVTPQVGVTFLNDADVSTSGVTYGTVGFDAGYGVGIAGGYDFGVVRLEGEAGYRKNDVDTFSEAGHEYPASGDVTAMSLLLNCLVDFETGTNFTPYAGAGIGMAQVEINEGADSEDDTVFAYQLVAGIGYTIVENVALDVSYRYFATANPAYGEGGGETEIEYGSHNFYMGIRFSF